MTNVGYSLPVRVYYEDTDAAGVVYYANYLRFMERVRTEWLNACGFEIDQLVPRFGLLFVVRSVQIDFLQPARLNDRLEVSVTLERLGRVSMVLRQVVQHGSDELCRARVKLASVTVDGVPKAIPDAIRQQLEKT
ncbi:MAG: tol-pal system-associated acyl-CoA thioesterase [Gammaproteobacteria bacterium]|nr:tol-pal system-associated acyl-CoA thioesterase [Gammaproteobacteria bacterium]